MAYLVLARKYRPQTFSEVIGQEHITRTLTHAISSGRVAHAILFSGPRGTGKTTVARLLAKAMNCEAGPTPTFCNCCQSCREITTGGAADVFEIDGASNNSVDQVRELRENVKYLPAHSPYKIYIIDEVHMLSIAAFNALLKTLEEPPAHVMFVFATTEPQKIPITILSRCQRYDFRRIGINAVVEHLKKICSTEDSRIDDQSLWLVAREAGGSMRDALSLLDQVMACSDGAITYEYVLTVLGGIDREIIFAFSDAVLKGDIPVILDMIDEVYDRGHDLKKFYEHVVQHFRDLMVVKMGNAVTRLVDLPESEIQRMQDQVRPVSAIFLTQIFEYVFNEETTVKFSVQPKLALEIAFIKVAHIRPVLPIDVLIEKLDTLRQHIYDHGVDSYGCDDKAAPCSDQYSDRAGQKLIQDQEALEQIHDPVQEFVEQKPQADLSPDSIWQRIVDMIMETHPPLGANLAACRLKSFDGQRLVIEVNGSGFNLTMIRREKNMAVLKKICHEVAGEKLDIVIHENISKQDDRQKKNQDDTRLRQEALSHPVVAEALEIFEGKIEDIRIL
ncbi:MAG: DNA polymerase III subunit gamma/tau [Desulfobacterales bacterium]|nr:DNA polymerase III subunit gamma/tau [Desulfobacterales bacterium]MDD4391649.1 DNA polymerase III subunit gamma/tau [Desulfobacterales bacterium]